MAEMIVWACIIAAALIIEYFTCDFTSVWFSVSGAASLVLASFNIDLNIQIIVFIVLSVIMILSLRPVCKKFFTDKTTPTNADANIGKVVKLLDDTADGKANIKINDVIWTAVCRDNLPKDTAVKITGIDGNKFIVEEFKEEVK
jgi:membrane protein implicated in regulation of membrane protease activity